MKLSQIVNKIMLNANKFIMRSYSHTGAKNFFFEMLSTLARYNATKFYRDIKTGIYFILYFITYQNIKTV